MWEKEAFSETSRISVIWFREDLSEVFIPIFFQGLQRPETCFQNHHRHGPSTWLPKSGFAPPAPGTKRSVCHIAHPSARASLWQDPNLGSLKVRWAMIGLKNEGETVVRDQSWLVMIVIIIIQKKMAWSAFFNNLVNMYQHVCDAVSSWILRILMYFAIFTDFTKTFFQRSNASAPQRCDVPGIPSAPRSPRRPPSRPSRCHRSKAPKVRNHRRDLPKKRRYWNKLYI